MESESLEAVHRFVDAINSHDSTALCQLLSSGHRFVDSLGTAVEGRENVTAAWRSYFEMVPAYRLKIESEMVSCATVVLFGRASGNLAVQGVAISKSEWSTPVCVRSRVESRLVEEWQVFSDNEPVRALLRMCHSG